jgi:hypothetical protein
LFLAIFDLAEIPLELGSLPHLQRLYLGEGRPSDDR